MVGRLTAVDDDEVFEAFHPYPFLCAGGFLSLKMSLLKVFTMYKVLGSLETPGFVVLMLSNFWNKGRVGSHRDIFFAVVRIYILTIQSASCLEIDEKIPCSRQSVFFFECLTANDVILNFY